MKWINIIILSSTVWLLQLLLSDSLSISSVRPDFCAILILYWSLIYGRTFGICSGFLFGLIIYYLGIATLRAKTRSVRHNPGVGQGSEHAATPRSCPLLWVGPLFFFGLPSGHYALYSSV